ncbi:alpha/beta hydrolase [Hydrogenophaga laconesensis]|uniref:Pimeloyl-ACP methyl ester carboxylesterase n=1 Tax=Hydrogenophaga laconesensis TaxID=1805971 RepID=A0ABU1V7V5_9BURK|nr:hypothetical protein [Hydrogenophaga laconesensis]MDR7093544.1 pimeloyl-ACP methyl ester carboxylesterase [Hydrogenophaga laconesensis]
MKPLRTVGTLKGASHLIAMLPGAAMRPEEIFEAGMADAVARRGLPMDLLAVDIGELGLDALGTWDTLQTGVLTPARERGARVWLGGISLGGMVAMAHLAARPGVVDGLCLLAPYAGSRPSLNVIERAGGVDRWQPTAQDLQDPELRVWQWLRRPPADLPVFVGHGTEDRFAARIQQVSDRFPAASRHTVPGGHDWSAWLPLWERFLDTAPLKN